MAKMYWKQQKAFAQLQNRRQWMRDFDPTETTAVEFLLENDIVRTIKELSREYPWFNDLEEGARRDAIINMHFNLGRARFASFKMALYHMENGRHQDASSEFLNSKWAKQVKGRALEITDMISTNTYV